MFGACKIAGRRHLSEEALVVHIRAVYAANRGAYGWPRVWRELRSARHSRGQAAGATADAAARYPRPRQAAFPRTTTDSRHDLPIAPNLLNRNFTVAAPNQAWTGDITYSTPSQRSPPAWG